MAFGWTRELLALFRPEFVDEGTTALRLLATATAFSVLFALAPTYLKYQRRNVATFFAVAGATTVQIVLLFCWSRTSAPPVLPQPMRFDMRYVRCLRGLHAR